MPSVRLRINQALGGTANALEKMAADLCRWGGVGCRLQLRLGYRLVRVYASGVAGGDGRKRPPHALDSRLLGRVVATDSTLWRGDYGLHDERVSPGCGAESYSCCNPRSLGPRDGRNGCVGLAGGPFTARHCDRLGCEPLRRGGSVTGPRIGLGCPSASLGVSCRVALVVCQRAGAAAEFQFVRLRTDLMNESTNIQVSGLSDRLTDREIEAMVGSVVNVPIGGTIPPEGLSWYELFRFARVIAASPKSRRKSLRCPICEESRPRYSLEVQWEAGYESKFGNLLCE